MHFLIALTLFLGVVRAGNNGDVEEVVELPVNIREWNTNPSSSLERAGLVHLLLNDVFLDPNTGNNLGNSESPRPKPQDFMEYAYAVNAGDCISFAPLEYWNMVQKMAGSIPGANPQTRYFIQRRPDVYSNEAGFQYGFDTGDCTSRSITAQVLFGGEFVRAIHRSADVPQAPQPSPPPRRG